MNDTQHYAFDLPEGTVSITIPRNLSTDDVEDLRAWFELIMRGILRRAEKKDE